MCTSDVNLALYIYMERERNRERETDVYIEMIYTVTSELNCIYDMLIRYVL